jgi:hypothetical protein
VLLALYREALRLGSKRRYSTTYRLMASAHMFACREESGAREELRVRSSACERERSESARKRKREREKAPRAKRARKATLHCGRTAASVGVLLFCPHLVKVF